MPLELTQKMELQLLKNSNEARILMFVTITGLCTAVKSPVQASDSFSSSFSTALVTSRSMLNLSNLDTNGVTKLSMNERAEKSTRPNLPINYLQLVGEHFVSATT